MPYSEFSPRHSDTPEVPTEDEERLAIIQELKKTHNAEQRVAMVANIFDKKGVDFFIGLIPALGDGAVALGLTAYLSFEAYKVGLPKKDVLRILRHQSVDFAVGSIPIVGDAYDLLVSKATVKSLRYFEERTKEIVEKAKEKGISETEIEALIAGARTLRTRTEVIVKSSLLKKTIKAAVKKLSGGSDTKR